MQRPQLASLALTRGLGASAVPLCHTPPHHAVVVLLPTTTTVPSDDEDEALWLLLLKTVRSKLPKAKCVPLRSVKSI